MTTGELDVAQIGPPGVTIERRDLALRQAHL